MNPTERYAGCLSVACEWLAQRLGLVTLQRSYWPVMGDAVARCRSLFFWRLKQVRHLMWSTILSVGLCVSGTSVTLAADEIVNFDNPAHKVMYEALLKEYRCLKCQNQNLWDSNASLAGDLRREIRGQILDGKVKTDIDEYLVARYGEFVLYRPRFNSKTAILWIGPFALLFIGLASLVLMVRSRKKAAGVDNLRVVPVDAAERFSEDKLAKARELLKGD